MPKFFAVALVLLLACRTTKSPSGGPSDGGQSDGGAADSGTAGSADQDQLIEGALNFYDAQAKSNGAAQARAALTGYLQSRPEIAEAHQTESGYAWLFTTRVGQPGLVIPYNQIPDWAERTIASRTREGAADSCAQPTPRRFGGLDLSPIKRKAVVLDWGKADPDELAVWNGMRDGIVDELKQLDVAVEVHESPSLDDILNISDAGLVILVGHGHFETDSKAWLWTDTKWTTAAAWADAQTPPARWRQNEDCSRTITTFDDPDHHLCEIVPAGLDIPDALNSLLHTRFTYVTPAFFSRLRSFAGGLVIANVCWGANAGSQMPAIFFRKGIDAFIGNTARGFASKVGLVTKGMVDAMVNDAWDAQGALNGLNEGVRTGAPRLPAESHACTEMRLNEGVNSSAFLTKLTLDFQKIPADATSIHVKATLPSSANPAIDVWTFDVKNGALVESNVVSVVSTTGLETYEATAVRGAGKATAFGKISPKHEAEKLTLTFGQSCDNQFGIMHSNTTSCANVRSPLPGNFAVIGDFAPGDKIAVEFNNAQSDPICGTFSEVWVSHAHPVLAESDQSPGLNYGASRTLGDIWPPQTKCDDIFLYWNPDPPPAGAVVNVTDTLPHKIVFQIDSDAVAECSTWDLDPKCPPSSDPQHNLHDHGPAVVIQNNGQGQAEVRGFNISGG